jgi:hypothetical protein
MTSISDRFDPLERPDRYDDRLETERHSEAASRAAFLRPLAPLTTEERLAADLRNESWELGWRLERLLLSDNRLPPKYPVVIERDGCWLTLYDRFWICFSTKPGVGTRLTAEEALAFQAKFPVFLANTTVKELTQSITRSPRSSGNTASSASPSMATALPL